ncbi:hypothetical protein [Rhizobacter sp. Root1221]|uniref:hypothetical protein n=1 Tax=Rhizobacter sp. Root1221 TaxID=1736433 RepID=UPI000AAA4057|nr:hypothetical protein [Rhizobacter sp. Root1221]
MNTTTCVAAAAVCFWVAGAAHALGRVVPLAEVEARHPAQINWVTTCGDWRAAGQAGVYRVVHATLNAQSLLYVQWLYTDGRGINKAAHTLALPEVNNDHAEIELTRLRCDATRTGVVVRARAAFGHEGTNGKVEVNVFQRPGAYRFGRR